MYQSERVVGAEQLQQSRPLGAPPTGDRVPAGCGGREPIVARCFGVARRDILERDARVLLHHLPEPEACLNPVLALVIARARTSTHLPEPLCEETQWLEARAETVVAQHAEDARHGGGGLGRALHGDGG